MLDARRACQVGVEISDAKLKTASMKVSCVIQTVVSCCMTFLHTSPGVLDMLRRRLCRQESEGFEEVGALASRDNETMRAPSRTMQMGKTLTRGGVIRKRIVPLELRGGSGMNKVLHDETKALFQNERMPGGLPHRYRAPPRLSAGPSNPGREILHSAQPLFPTHASIILRQVTSRYCPTQATESLTKPDSWVL